MQRTTRRDLLRTGAAAGVAGLSLIAGCGGGGGGGGGGSDGGSGDGGGGSGGGTATATPTSSGSTGTTTVSGPPAAQTYRGWLPSASELRGGGNYSIFYYDVAGFREHKSALGQQGYGRVQQLTVDTASTLGINGSNVTSVLQFVRSDTRVVTGSFGLQDVTEGLERYQKNGQYHEYRLYSGGKGRPVVAVGDGVALLCEKVGSNPPMAVARMLIDVARGDLQRYHETDDSFDLATKDFTDATHTAAVMMPEVRETSLEQGTFKGQVGTGTGFDVGSSKTSLTWVRVFADRASAKNAKVETWAKEHSKGLKPYDNVSTSVDGRTVTVTGTTSTGNFDFLRSG